jgi:hypothetical protein
MCTVHEEIVVKGPGEKTVKFTLDICKMYINFYFFQNNVVMFLRSYK